MRLLLETEGGGAPFVPPGEGAALVAFMSFAVMRGFGAAHPLIALADHVHGAHGVPLGPLTTFYEAGAEDAEDSARLELAWQQPAELARALEALAKALEADSDARELAREGGAQALEAEARALLPILGEAEAKGARVRMVYEL